MDLVHRACEPISRPILLAFVLVALAGARCTPARAHTAVAAGVNPCAVSGWSGITAIAAGAGHTVGLKDDGTVVAVGNNCSGQCYVSSWHGISAIDAGWWYTAGLKDDGTVVVTGAAGGASAWSGIVAIAAGSSHMVGLKGDGTVVAAGDNSRGQCEVSVWRGIVAVAAGDFHTVGLKGDGTVVTAGGNDERLANVSDWRGIAAVSAGQTYTIGMRGDGSVVAAGALAWDLDGASGWSKVTAIDAGSFHAVGLRPDGTVAAAGWTGDGRCEVSGWGGIVAVAAGHDHTVGLKGDGTVVATGPAQCAVSGWRELTAVAAGACHTLGLRGDGTVVALGNNNYGQCDVSDWRGIVAVAAGQESSVGLRADGTMVAVGDAYAGQCNVSHWSGIVAIAAGGWHTVGLKSDGTVVAIGQYETRQCDVQGWHGIVAIAAGISHTVGVRRDGTVVAIGSNSYGQCEVSGWSDIVAVAAGFHHTVGLKRDGTVVATGGNYDGQCNVSGWRGITAIAAGGCHTVGLKVDGTVAAVGQDIYGQCQTADWHRVTAIAAGGWHTVGLTQPRLLRVLGPARGTAGALLPPVQVALQDDHGVAIAANGDVTLEVTPVAGTPECAVCGTTTRSLVNGIATFSNLALRTAGRYRFTAAATDCTPGTSVEFSIAPAGPYRLAFTAQPADTTCSTPLRAVKVTVHDRYGNTVPKPAAEIRVALGANASGGALSGTTTAFAAGGTATFGTLCIGKVGRYTLTASAEGLPTAMSAAFNVVVGPAFRLAFLVEPSDARAGVPIAPAVQVVAQDRAGHVATAAAGNVTVGLSASPGGGVLSGTRTVALRGGVARFADLKVSNPGSGYVLRASAAGLLPANSGVFAVTTPGAPARLVFALQPTTTRGGQRMAEVSVTVQDAFGNVAASPAMCVTLALGANAAGGTLSGSTSVATTGGTATFSALRIDKVGRYTLTASAEGLRTATSVAFSVTR